MGRDEASTLLREREMVCRLRESCLFPLYIQHFIYMFSIPLSPKPLLSPEYVSFLSCSLLIPGTDGPRTQNLTRPWSLRAQRKQITVKTPRHGREFSQGRGTGALKPDGKKLPAGEWNGK